MTTAGHWHYNRRWHHTDLATQLEIRHDDGDLRTRDDDDDEDDEQESKQVVELVLPDRLSIQTNN